MSYGVRKVNEYIIRDGRALILTQDSSAGLTLDQWKSIENGTLCITQIANSNDRIIRYKHDDNTKGWTKFIPEQIFDQNTIVNGLIADNAITERTINNDAVTINKIKNRNVTGTKIATNTIKTENIYTKTDSNGIVTSGLDADVLSQKSIVGNKIADKTISTDKIMDGAIDTNQIANSAVTNDKIAENAIDSKQIVTGAIGSNEIASGSIKTEHIVVNGLDAGKVLTSKTITYDKIKDSAIRTNHLYKDAVTNPKIGPKAVSYDKIADKTITAGQIEDKTITAAQIADETITATQITNGTITTKELEDSINDTLNSAVLLKNGTVKIAGNITSDIDNASVTTMDQSKVRSITGFKVYNPVFADYAEGFESDEQLEPGDIVEIKSENKIGKASSLSTKVVGVVSNRYGICLDASEEELKNKTKIPIGLIGKVPVKIKGPINVGDFVISYGDGIGIASKEFLGGKIIGKALESNTKEDVKEVLCIIQLM